LRANHAGVLKNMGRIDGSHASAPQLTLDAVTVAEGLSELWGWSGHLVLIVEDASNLVGLRAFRQQRSEIVGDMTASLMAGHPPGSSESPGPIDSRPVTRHL
jgi:hypothetical protein